MNNNNNKKGGSTIVKYLPCSITRRRKKGTV